MPRTAKRKTWLNTRKLNRVNVWVNDRWELNRLQWIDFTENSRLCGLLHLLFLLSFFLSLSVSLSLSISLLLSWDSLAIKTMHKWKKKLFRKWSDKESAARDKQTNAPREDNCNCCEWFVRLIYSWSRLNKIPSDILTRAFKWLRSQNAIG